MVLMSFSCEEKKEKLINKECSQTIRTPRKNPIEVGDRLQIYWKVRKAKDSKDVHKIGEGIVTEIFRICFDKIEIENPYILKNEHGITFGREKQENIAKRDGFDSLEQMLRWFYGKYNYIMFHKDFKVIRWEWESETEQEVR